MNWYLGVDAGGTRCRARLVDENGVVRGAAEGGSANTRIGLELVHETLLSTCLAACEMAGLTREKLADIHVGIGIAGLSRVGAKEALQAADFPFAHVHFTSDGAIANLGAHLGDDGAILSLGTGSIAFVRVGGREFTIGGYGFPISDEGSGAALGLSAIRHALRALDGRTRPTPLSEEVTRRFNHEITQVITWMDQATASDYATFAPLVLDRADLGDEIALLIVRDAALHVERFIETIFARGAPRCALMGGLAERLKPWLRLRIIDQLCKPARDALDGALLFAGLPPAKLQPMS